MAKKRTSVKKGPKGKVDVNGESVDPPTEKDSTSSNTAPAEDSPQKTPKSDKKKAKEAVTPKSASKRESQRNGNGTPGEDDKPTPGKRRKVEPASDTSGGVTLRTRPKQLRSKAKTPAAEPVKKGTSTKKVVKKTKKSTPKKTKDFEVDEILEEREKKGKKEYLVRWKGYTAEDDSWEPESNLKKCPQLLDEFKEKGEAKEAEE